MLRARRPAEIRPDEEGVIVYDGIRFVFSFTGEWPTLTTVMAAKKRDEEEISHG